MAISPAKYASNRKHDVATYDKVTVSYRKADAARIRAAAAAAGVPLAQYIRDAVLAKLNADSVPLCETERE